MLNTKETAGLEWDMERERSVAMEGGSGLLIKGADGLLKLSCVARVEDIFIDFRKSE